MKQFSYIFTYRQIAADRQLNLIRVLEWLDSLNMNFELIIVEQDDTSKFKLPEQKYNFNIIHKFYYNPGLFNRSWGFNLATKLATTEYLFFADSDMIVPQTAIRECLTLLSSTYESAKPFNKIIDLNKQQVGTVDVRSNISNLNLTKGERNPLRGGWNYGSGIVAFTKVGLAKIHGWDERFEGWGGEDDIQKHKTKQLLRHRMLSHTCYHLWHSRGRENGTNMHPHYKENLRLFWRYQKQPGLIVREMLNHNTANPNKYRGR